MVFFGDSLSDNGNLYRFFLKIIPKSPPYYDGRFSNGSTWAEIVGNYYHDHYNVDYQISAVGGATAILRNPAKGALPYTIGEQVDSYLLAHPFKDKSQILYAIWIGANDYMDEKDQEINGLINDVVNATSDSVVKLINKGAKNVMLLDQPDLSKVPFAFNASADVIARLNELSLLNHQKMVSLVDTLKKQYPDVNFVYIDIYDLFNDIFQDTQKYNQKYNLHINNLTDSCWLGGYTLRSRIAKMNDVMLNKDMTGRILKSTSLLEAYTVGKLSSMGVAPCDDPDDYLFWDKVHPTAVTHQLLAAYVLEQLAQNHIVEN